MHSHQVVVRMVRILSSRSDRELLLVVGVHGGRCTCRHAVLVVVRII